MSSKAARNSRRDNAKSKQSGLNPKLPEFPEMSVAKERGKEFKPLNKAQESFLNKIENNTLTFAVGPAGTGKTFVAAMAAAKAYKSGEVKKIIISRPAVTSGEDLGFLPGDMREKFDPYVAPLVECLGKILGTGQVESMIEYEKIVFLPLAFMRGHSWNEAFVIIDESQNITKTQMKLALTRIGKNTKVVIDGDLSQRDIPVDGLEDAIKRLDRIPSVAVQRFTQSDIVRSGLVKSILLAYSDKTSDFEIEEEDTTGLEKLLSSRV